MQQKQANELADDIAARTSAQTAARLSPSLAQRLLLAGGVGAMLAVCFPPVGLYFLLPCGVAGLLRLLRGLTPRPAFYVGMACGTAWFCGDLFWLTRLFGAAAFSLCALLALFPALFAALFVSVRARLPQVPAWLLAPLLWTGIEYYRSELFALKFGWLGLGYGVVNAPLLAHVASWVGCYGLSFGIVLLGAILSSTFADMATGAQKRQTFWRVGAALVAWLALCLIPLAPPMPVHPLRVRLVQANSEDEENFYRLSRLAPGQPTDVIVWPEYSFVTDPDRTPKLWPKIRRVAQENHAYLLFGAKDQFDTGDEAGFRNTAFLLDPNGTLIGRHVKNHPVHFIRDGVAGTDAQAIQTPLGRVGVAICFDMDYPDVARRLAQDGATVFLVPNDDPPEWGRSSASSTAYYFRCEPWSAAAGSDARTWRAAHLFLPRPGRRSPASPQRSPPCSTRRWGRETGQTWYVRGGWRFGPSCLLASVLLWGLALLRGVSWGRPRRTRTRSTTK